MYGLTRGFAYVAVLLMAAGSVAAEGVSETKTLAKTLVITGESNAQGTVGVAPTEAEAEAAYDNARRSFLAVASGGPDVKAVAGVSSSAPVEDTVAGGKPSNIALEDIRLVMDLDNVTLREVMQKIVQQAAAYTGPWTVKWRLKQPNMDLMDERVSLTAEANFGEFCSLLTERIKNMTGAQLYITAFAGTRVLLVTDTYF